MRRATVAAVCVLALLAGGSAGPAALDPTAPERVAPVAPVAPGADDDREVVEEPASAVEWAPTAEQEARARRIADGLSLPDLAGQLIIARHGDSAASLALVRDLHLAGVLVNDPALVAGEGGDLARVTAFNAELAAAGRERGAPVLRPLDQEGGLVARVREPLTVLGTFMAAGAALTADAEDGSEVVRRATRGTAAELRALGYNAVFAPVADLAIGADQPGIGSRSAGSSPELVSDAVAATVQGHADAGLISTAKHFPGHNVTVDSHRAVPVLDGSREELERRDLVPFLEAIDLGVPALMTGHLDVPALDARTPVSMSRPVLTGLLREELGYEGLIVSDALDMGAVTDRYPAGDAVVATLVAGSDLALMPVDATGAHAAVERALRSGELSEQQARESATRTIAWQLAQEGTAPLPGEPGESADAARDLAVAGTVVVARPCDRPLAVEAVVPLGPPELVDRFVAAAREAGLGVGRGPRLGIVGVGGDPPAADIVVTTDTPYALARSRAPVRIALHGSGPSAMRALAESLVGDAEPTGRLPVEVPGLEPASC